MIERLQGEGQYWPAGCLTYLGAMGETTLVGPTSSSSSISPFFSASNLRCSASLSFRSRILSSMCSRNSHARTFFWINTTESCSISLCKRQVRSSSVHINKVTTGCKIYDHFSWLNRI